MWRVEFEETDEITTCVQQHLTSSLELLPNFRPSSQLFGIASMPEIIDDKSEHCVPFIIDRIKEHREAFESKGEKPTPFFVGLNGVQGAGKTTLV
jgi:pantothenate kinase-related protein Tda10